MKISFEIWLFFNTSKNIIAFKRVNFWGVVVEISRKSLFNSLYYQIQQHILERFQPKRSVRVCMETEQGGDNLDAAAQMTRKSCLFIKQEDGDSLLPAGDSLWNVCTMALSSAG